MSVLRIENDSRGKNPGHLRPISTQTVALKDRMCTMRASKISDGDLVKRSKDCNRTPSGSPSPQDEPPEEWHGCRPHGQSPTGRRLVTRPRSSRPVTLANAGWSFRPHEHRGCKKQ